jgi:hypothetical protein
MRYDRYYCYAISQQNQDSLNFGEIDLLIRKMQKPQWSGPMASCPPGRARAHVRAHEREQAGPGASGPACETAHENARRAGEDGTGREQHAEKTAWPFRTEIFMTNLNIRLSSYLFTIRPFVVPRKR